MPIFSKTWQGFDKTTTVPLNGSGPYKIARVVPGQRVYYEKVPDFWGADLPVNRGMYNIQKIQHIYYRDLTVALEAFKKGKYQYLSTLRFQVKRRFFRKLRQRQHVADG